ncbi:MAG: TolC family protein [Proteobacteria bacterium]|nr:TolC family protein [Pseudomonadota bacterium]
MSINFLCFLLLTLADAALSEETLPNKLTIEQAKEIAISKNANLASRKSDLDIAIARKGRASSGMYPTIEGRLGSETSLNTQSNENDNSAKFAYLQATMNIYRGGLDIAKKNLSNLETKKLQIVYESEKLILENAVEVAFANLLFTRDLIDIKTRFIKINEDQKALARQIASRGSGSQSDVVEFDLRAIELSSELSQIQQDYLATLIQLKLLIGENIAKNIIPTGDLPHLHLHGSLKDYINTGLKDTPSLTVSSLDLEMAQHQIASAQSRWLPKVDFEGKFGILPNETTKSSAQMNSSFAVVASWEIFAGFDSTYELQERRAEKERADFVLQGNISQMMADVETRYNELVAIQARSDLEKNNILVAKNYYDLIYADFKRGYKNSGDYSAAAEKLYNSEVRRKRLDLEFLEKKAALENRIGRKVASISMKDIPLIDEQKAKRP